MPVDMITMFNNCAGHCRQTVIGPHWYKNDLILNRPIVWLWRRHANPAEPWEKWPGPVDSCAFCGPRKRKHIYIVPDGFDLHHGRDTFKYIGSVLWSGAPATSVWMSKILTGQKVQSPEKLRSHTFTEQTAEKTISTRTRFDGALGYTYVDDSYRLYRCF